MCYSEPALAQRLLYPDRQGTRERMFDELARHGFDWERFVDREPTLQLRFERLDELRGFPDFVQRAVKGALHWAERRGGLDGPGRASDHSPIVAWFE